jgi:hypothetical protein
LIGESVREETDDRKSRFTEDQIIGIFAEQERGLSTAEVCRKHGISGTRPAVIAGTVMVLFWRGPGYRPNQPP